MVINIVEKRVAVCLKQGVLEGTVILYRVVKESLSDEGNNRAVERET